MSKGRFRFCSAVWKNQRDTDNVGFLEKSSLMTEEVDGCVSGGEGVVRALHMIWGALAQQF